MREYRLWRGYTLAQILVVTAIIVVLAALVFPLAMSGRQSVTKAQCRGNLAALASEIAAFTHANQGGLPSADTLTEIASKTGVSLVCPFWGGDKGNRQRYLYAYSPRQILVRKGQERRYSDWMELCDSLFGRDAKDPSKPYPIVSCYHCYDPSQVIGHGQLGEFKDIPLIADGPDKQRFLGATLSGRTGYYETEAMQDEIARWIASHPPSK